MERVVTMQTGPSPVDVFAAMLSSAPIPPDVVVTVTPTIGDGTVVAWYASMGACELHAPMVTASRNGVRVAGYLNELPQALLSKALAACAELRRDDSADMSGYATHRRRGLFGAYEPILRVV